MTQGNDTKNLSTLSKQAPTMTSEITDTSQSRLSIQSGIELMTRFAIRRGIALPTVLDKGANASDITIYNTLAEAIHPSTIQSIEYIDSMRMTLKENRLNFFRIPIFTKCLLIAGIALVTLISISLLPTVNEDNLSAGLLASSGTVLLANLVFVCSAALLGVMFYLLKTVSDKIKSYSLLPIDVIEVNTTILIGLISGFIIAELFAFTADPLGNNIELHKMTLALLGGFSSDVIFSVLQGIVNKAKRFLAT